MDSLPPLPDEVYEYLKNTSKEIAEFARENYDCETLLQNPFTAPLEIVTPEIILKQHTEDSCAEGFFSAGSPNKILLRFAKIGRGSRVWRDYVNSVEETSSFNPESENYDFDYFIGKTLLGPRYRRVAAHEIAHCSMWDNIKIRKSIPLKASELEKKFPKKYLFRGIDSCGHDTLAINSWDLQEQLAEMASIYILLPEKEIKELMGRIPDKVDFNPFDIFKKLHEDEMVSPRETFLALRDSVHFSNPSWILAYVSGIRGCGQVDEGPTCFFPSYDLILPSGVKFREYNPYLRTKFQVFDIERAGLVPQELDSKQEIILCSNEVMEPSLEQERFRKHFDLGNFSSRPDFFQSYFFRYGERERLESILGLKLSAA